MPVATPLDVRVWAKIEKRGPAECWPWTGATGEKGQPVTSVGKKSLSVRRVLWEITRGEALPATRHVTTTCRVPSCLNPDHLCLRPFGDDVARFWTFVQKAEGDACWLWTGARTGQGYGAFTVCSDPRAPKLMKPAHRVAYEITHGVKLPADLVVMHKCDNPPCVRPDHLKPGTVLDNNRDAIAKGRSSRGEKHAAAMRAAREVSVSQEGTKR